MYEYSVIFVTDKGKCILSENMEQMSF